MMNINENIIPPKTLRIIFSLKSFIFPLKHKYFYCIILFFSIVNAKEPSLAKLDKVVSNDIQKFTIANFEFYTNAYGVISVDKLYRDAEVNSECRKKIDNFYLENPKMKHSSFVEFRKYQFYHIEFKKNGTIIYLKGQKSLSQFLLEEGLAIIEPLFEDEEFSGIFKRSENQAKNLKKGLHKSNLLKNCSLK